MPNHQKTNPYLLIIQLIIIQNSNKLNKILNDRSIRVFQSFVVVN